MNRPNDAAPTDGKAILDCPCSGDNFGTSRLILTISPLHQRFARNDGG
jgi:hypothetical protein